MTDEAKKGRVSRPVLGLIAIAGLVVGLQIPVAMIQRLIADRVLTRDVALRGVVDTWGAEQSIVGPRLQVPVRAPTGHGGVTYVNILPDRLTVQGSVGAESLSRGLFSVPVYQAHLTLEGAFTDPDVEALGIDPDALLWEQTLLVVEVSDPKTIGAESTVRWAGVPVDLRPGAGASERTGVHARVDGRAAEFELELAIRGSSAIWLVPFSRDTRVELSSEWTAPSFSGAWLPQEREVTAAGFTAVWQVPHLGREYPQAWLEGDDPVEQIVASRFGVELVSPVDHYRMAERSTKYAALFLALTFGVLWLLDVLVGVRVHPVQLLLIGSAMCLFYLLELSLSEHFGFVPAYLVAAGSVIVLISGYSRAVLRSTRRGLSAAALLGGLYSYLLTLLSLERYSLLVGSVGLFVLLGATMYLTRWVDWDSMVRERG